MVPAAAVVDDDAGVGVLLSQRQRPATVSTVHSIGNRHRCRSTIHRPDFCIGSVDQSLPCPLISVVQIRIEIELCSTESNETS